MLSQSTKHDGGWPILKLKTTSKKYFIQDTQQRTASHLECCSVDENACQVTFWSTNPSPRPLTNPNCWTNSLGGQSTNTYFVILTKPLGKSPAGPYIFWECQISKARDENRSNKHELSTSLHFQSLQDQEILEVPGYCTIESLKNSMQHFEPITTQLWISVGGVWVKLL